MKSIPAKYLVPALALVAAVTVAATALADRKWKQVPNPDEVVFDEQFTFSGAPQLTVELDDLDVELVHGEAGKARVQVEVKSRDRDDAMDYFDDLRFAAEMDGSELIVETRRRPIEIHFGWSWTDRTRARVIITIPKGTDMQVKTSDGDLSGGEIEGSVDVHTGDGDIRFDSVKGDDAKIKAADGDIDVETIDAREINVAASDGDLTLGMLKGDVVTLKTSDGDVRVRKIDASDIAIRSSDGDVVIDEVTGMLKARTSDGDISIGITSGLEMELSTSDGDVFLKAPGALSASLDLRGEHVSIRGRHEFEGDITDNRVKGKLGGGGPMIVARTSDGDVSLDLR